MKKLSEILNSFIQQSKTDNLKWSTYPKEYLDLNMKVSFGQGVPARVSWISFLAPEMQTSNGFYPVYLFYKKEKKLKISNYGIVWISFIKGLIIGLLIYHFFIK